MIYRGVCFTWFFYDIEVWHIYIFIDTSRAGQAGGGSFQKKTPISQRKNLPIECAQGDQPLRCPNRVF